jgi:hypothetical protein
LEGTTESPANSEGDSTRSVPPIIEDQEMNYCEMETQGPVLGFCDQRASVKVENHWYCQHHADALAQAQERWSGINWFPLTCKKTEKQSEVDDDGRFWDEGDYEVL